MIFSGRAIACVVAGLIGCSSSMAAIYYVDAERGNDGSTGTAAVAAAGGVGPWQSLGRVGTASLAAGDTIQLACGSVWAETLRVPASGAAGAPITIAAAPGCQTPPAAATAAVPVDPSLPRSAST